MKINTIFIFVVLFSVLICNLCFSLLAGSADHHVTN